MMWLAEDPAVGNQHREPGTVPVVRVGGRLTSGTGWSATAFPVVYGRRTLIVTSQHVLDGAGTSELLAVSNVNALDEFAPKPIDLDDWIRGDLVDLAAVEVPGSFLGDWRIAWPAGSCSVDLTKVQPDAGLTVSVQWMPSPVPGTVERRVPVDAEVAGEIAPLEMPGEFVVPCLTEEGMSGSPVFVGDGSRFGLAGIVTSLIVDQRAVVGSVVLSASEIQRFIESTFP